LNFTRLDIPFDINTGKLKYGYPPKAQIFYAQAAQAELLALSDKAQAFHQAEQLAYQWLAIDSLPPFAVQSRRELLLDIWQQRPTPMVSDRRSVIAS
jgi:hypothetical protein